MEERKFSVEELASIFQQIPHYLWLLMVSVLAGNLNETSIKFVLTMKDVKDTDLAKALSNWNWDSHPPHTDPAILVLVEELLEEYCDNGNTNPEKND